MPSWSERKFASGQIHIDITAANGGTELSTQINWWVRRIYLAMIVAVIGAMFVHNALLFYRKTAARLRSSARPVLRMSASQRMQHDFGGQFHYSGNYGICAQVSRFMAGQGHGFERTIPALDPSHRRAS